MGYIANVVAPSVSSGFCSERIHCLLRCDSWTIKAVGNDPKKPRANGTEKQLGEWGIVKEMLLTVVQHSLLSQQPSTACLQSAFESDHSHSHSFSLGFTIERTGFAEHYWPNQR